MQKEKVALIVLVIVVVASLSVFLIAVNTDIFENLFTEPKVIAVGDCVNVSYIGRYASNNSVFDSSYTDWANKTGSNPLRIFVTTNKTASPPAGYEQYSSNYIQGMLEGLVGLRERQTATIDVSPEKGYGVRRLAVDDTFYTASLTYSTSSTPFNFTVKTIDINAENVILQWLNVDNLGNFTLPDGILMENLENAMFSIYDPLPPYYIWPNASRIINITNENVIIQTTPLSATNISESVIFATVGNKMAFVYPDATTAFWNDTIISLQSSPVKGSKYVFEYEGVIFNITIGNVTATNTNITIEMGGQTQELELNNTLEFNRTYTMRRIYRIPIMFAQYTVAADLDAQGYSLNQLAGERLLFEVTIEKVYKTS